MDRLISYHSSWGLWWASFGADEWSDARAWNAHMHAMMIAAIEAAHA